VDPLFHLCGPDNNHDRIDVDLWDAGDADVDEAPMALYLGCYDQDFLRQLHELDL
jgi:hypothetical protein